jgi:hypothetical protein
MFPLDRRDQTNHNQLRGLRALAARNEASSDRAQLGPGMLHRHDPLNWHLLPVRTEVLLSARTS